MINYIIKQSEEKLKEIQKILTDVKNLEGTLSQYIGTEVKLDLPWVREDYLNLTIRVKVPRNLGDDEIELLDGLTIRTNNLKEIILKMRRVERIILSKIKSYEILYGIIIPLGIDSFMKIDEEKIADMYIEKYRADNIENTPIEETFEYNDKLYKVIESKDLSCEKCSFSCVDCDNLKDKGAIPYCTESRREDDKNVIFIEAEEK